MMETWRRIWRDVVPLVSTPALESLAKALREDDYALVQGATTTPLVPDHESDPVTGACVWAYCGWRGDGLATKVEVEEYFARFCALADCKTGEVGGCRWFLNAYDEWSREEMRAMLIPEVELALGQRAGVLSPSPS